MNEKKKVGYMPALLLIIPFFLMIVFFVSSGGKKGDTVTDINIDFTVIVENGTVKNSSEVVEIPITKEGTYQFKIGWNVTEPGYITGCVIRDPKGELVSAFTAAWISGYSNQVSLSAGKSMVEFYFLTNAEDYRQFARTNQIFNSDKELEEFIEVIDFEAFTKNGDWNMSLSLEACEIIPAPVAPQLATLLVGVLNITFLFVVFAGDKESDDTLKGRIGSIGIRYSIFSMAVTLFQIAAMVLLKTYAPNVIYALGTNLSFLLIILSVDVVGFPLAYRVNKNLKKERLSQQKLGLGSFLLFVLMSAGLIGVGGLIGTLFHSALTFFSGNTSSGIADLMLSSGMFMRILTIGILAPIFEELIFRKLVIDHLIKYGEFVAILTSGLMFGLFHGNFQQCFFATFLGWLWAFVYVRTGRIHYTIMMHMIVNMSTSAITIYLLGKYMEYAPVNITDSSAVTQALAADPQTLFYTMLFMGWMGILGICCLAGIIIFIIFMSSGKFRLRLQEGEPKKGEVVKSILTDKYMWLFYLSCIGLFLISYL